MENVCEICIEPYTKVLRHKIDCFNCEFKACRKCIRYYIINSSNKTVGCMNCHIPWTDKFISNVLLKAFFKEQYKQHTYKNYIDEQLSLLPSTQPEVEAIKLKEKLTKERIYLYNETNNLYKDLVIVQKEIVNKHVTILEKNIKDTIDDEYKKGVLAYRNSLLTRLPSKKSITEKHHKSKKILRMEAYIIMNKEIATNPIYIKREASLNRINEIDKAINVSLKKDKILYNRPCSNSNCNGLLKYGNDLCGICDNITCSKCLVSYKKDDEHICDEDDIKTAQLIKKDTKYCPKCNFGITKLSGCDVMFCTQCTTSFNWKTMEILTKNLHNPHYIEYLRKNGTIRENTNLNINCIANPTIGDFDTRRFSNIRNFTENVKLFKPYMKIIEKGLNAIQYILHIGEQKRNLETKIQQLENFNRRSRIDLLLSNSDRKYFDQNVSKNSYEIRYLTQKHQIVSTIFDVSTELIFNLSNNEMMAINNGILNILEESHRTNNFYKIKDKNEEFFKKYMSLSIFDEVSVKLDGILTGIIDIANHCIKEDKELSLIYGKTSNYMLAQYIR